MTGPVLKKCQKCGKAWSCAPILARFSADPLFSGWYWECCGSTMYIPDLTLEQRRLRLEQDPKPLSKPKLT